MLLGLGTDLVDIGRIRAAYERQGDRLLQRILAPNERIQCANVSVERMVNLRPICRQRSDSEGGGCGIGRLRMNLVELVVGRGAAGPIPAQRIATRTSWTVERLRDAHVDHGFCNRHTGGRPGRVEDCTIRGTAEYM